MNPIVQIVCGILIIAICAVGGFFGSVMIKDGLENKKQTFTIFPSDIDIKNADWDEIYKLTVTNNKDYPIYGIQVHIFCDNNNFDVDHIEITPDSRGNSELLKLGDKNNYYSVDYSSIVFTAMNKSCKIRIIRINSLSPHSAKIYNLKFMTNKTNKEALIKIERGFFSKEPIRVVEKENDIAVPFMLGNRKLWLRIKLEKGSGGRPAAN